MVNRKLMNAEANYPTERVGTKASESRPQKQKHSYPKLSFRGL